MVLHIAENTNAQLRNLLHPRRFVIAVIIAPQRSVVGVDKRIRGAIVEGIGREVLAIAPNPVTLIGSATTSVTLSDDQVVAIE